MTISIRATGVGLLLVASSTGLLSGCLFDGSESPEADEDGSADVAVASVVIPTERLSPFCQAMIDLTDRFRSADEVTDAEIVETYRSISGDVPTEIADDFALVLQALEAGAPAPTDPPRATIQTLPAPEPPPSTDGSVTTGPSSSVPGSTAVDGEVDADVDGEIDERFDRDDSPAERINSYVSFNCRDSDNNPGPPATQPLDVPPPTTAD